MARILIADGRKDFINTLEKILADYGECVSASTGKEALAVFEDAWKEGNPFDLIFLDVALGEMGGIEVLKIIRQKEEKEKKPAPKQRIKIIMMSATANEKIIVECVKCGCSNFYLKSIDPALIISKLSAMGFHPERKQKPS